MKSQRIKIILFILLFSKSLFSFSEREKSFKAKILEDVSTINVLYSRQIFADPTIVDSNIVIEAIDSTPLTKVNSNIYKILVRFKHVHFNKHENYNSQRIYYLANDGKRIYKLFGFYSSEILIWLDETYYLKNNNFSSLSKELQCTKYFNRKQVKFILKSIKRKDTTFDKRFNVKCQILEPYFKDYNKRNASSIILLPDINRSLYI